VKFIIDNWMLFAVAISSAGMLFWPQIQSATGPSLTPAGAVQLINREKAVVVDVCEPDEFAKEHLVGAKNLPFSQLEDKLTSLVKNKEVPLILVCASGVRSNRAVSVAKKLCYANAQSMAGGNRAWREASLPFDKS
jgi:rhodanese-related sulfurtransferase